MKYRIATVAIAVFALLSPQQMFAACPNISGPLGGTCSWYVYDVTDSACISQYGSPGGTTLSCYSTAGYEYDYLSGGPSSRTTTYSFTVSGSAQTDDWSVFQRVDFNDPGDSQWNWVSLQVVVTRSGSTIYNNTYFSHNGTQGDLSCAQPSITSFTAANGDVITINVSTQTVSSATIAVGHPYLTRSNNPNC